MSNIGKVSQSNAYRWSYTPRLIFLIMGLTVRVEMVHLLQLQLTKAVSEYFDQMGCTVLQSNVGGAEHDQTP